MATFCDKQYVFGQNVKTQQQNKTSYIKSLDRAGN